MTKVTAKSRILSYLGKGSGRNTLTVNQAQVKFGITNVSARIHELRCEGYEIDTKRVRRSDGRKCFQYSAAR